jgi:hypothetical protein
MVSSSVSVDNAFEHQSTSNEASEVPKLFVPDHLVAVTLDEIGRQSDVYPLASTV